jgi:hypothetical protein
VTPTTASDLGDRLILAPQEVNPRTSVENIRQSLRGFADRVNVIVIVPSHRAAAAWADVADAVPTADELPGVVDRLQGGHVGLVVLINRYDGIDLPESACSILVLDGLPEAYGPAERRESIVIGDADAMIGRQLRRIEQGMGRGVRSAEDHCVVLLMGSRLTRLVADPAGQAHFSPATRAQLELSREVMRTLTGSSIADMEAVMQQVLDRDTDWLAASRNRLAGVQYGEPTVHQDAVSARHALNQAMAGRFDEAARNMQEAVNATDDDRVKGWHKEQLAVYQHQLDPVLAQKTLASAHQLNRYVSRPRQGLQYRRVTANDDQAASACRFLARAYGDGNALVIGVDALAEAMMFHPDTTEVFEAGLARLGQHLGFRAQRPEKELGIGPDVLIALTDATYLVIECKSGASAGEISKRDFAQLANTMNWFAETYSRADGLPIIVHPVRRVAREATPPPRCRVMTPTALSSLVSALKAMAGALAGSGSWADESSVREQLTHWKLTAADLVLAFTDAPQRQR